VIDFLFLQQLGFIRLNYINIYWYTNSASFCCQELNINNKSPRDYNPPAARGAQTKVWEGGECGSSWVGVPLWRAPNLLGGSVVRVLRGLKNVRTWSVKSLG